MCISTRKRKILNVAKCNTHKHVYINKNLKIDSSGLKISLLLSGVSMGTRDACFLKPFFL